MLNKALQGHMKQSKNVNFENFPTASTMGAPKDVTTFVKSQSLPKMVVIKSGCMKPCTKPWEKLHNDYAGPYLDKMFLIVTDMYSK